MNQLDCVSLLSEMGYEKDIREMPDNRRKGQFKAGWEDFTIRGNTHNENSLKSLTWNNLGNRLGKELSPKSPDEIYEIYECFARHYRETH